jgi:NitT/TauT family transport system substrate-binding protein
MFNRTRFTTAGALALGLLAMLLAGCGQSTGGTSAITVGLTYVPNIQFAPFYAADALGYYKAAGLNVTLRHHNFGEDEFGALVSGHESLIFAGGDEVLQARAKGPDIVYVAQVFNQYPVSLIVPASSSAQSVADLRGKTIGIPGQYGATYIGLLSMLKSAGMKPTDVSMQSIGFTQVQALIGHKVDAVMGYSNNEPLLFEQQGFHVRSIAVGAGSPLVSNGIAAMRGELQAHPDTVKAFIAATLKGVDYVIANPEKAVSLSKTYVPGLDDSVKAADALSVLKATLPFWQHASGSKHGYSDPAKWQAMANFMSGQGLVTDSVDGVKAIDNSFLS